MPLLPIALVSCAALGLEILLMRLYAIVQWHHFAYLAVSLALLGYGAAGTAIALSGERLHRHFHQAFAVAALLCGLSMPAAFMLVQAMPFNALEILWDPRQWLWLAAQYLVLFVPFFFAAFCLCLSFSRFGPQSSRIYAADLLGAAGGAALVLGLVYLLPPMRALLAVAALALLAAALVWPQRAFARLLLLAALLLPWAVPSSLLPLQPSAYKPLSQMLDVPDARVVTQLHGPMGQVSVVTTPSVPLRHAPGLSLNAQTPIPVQFGVFVDGEGPGALVSLSPPLPDLTFLEHMSSAAPYALVHAPRVLVLGAGAGLAVLQGVQHGARRVDAVELNPQVAALAQAEFARGGLANHVRWHVADARSFAAGSSERFDLIILPLADNPASVSAGLHGMAEDYLHTVEAVGQYLDRLAPEGILVFNRWMQVPPRDTIKLLATAVEALAQAGIAQPTAHLALLRSWQSTVVLVKRTPFGMADTADLQAFAHRNSFDLEWSGGPLPHSAPPFHRLDQPYFKDAFTELAGNAADRKDFYRRYKFHIAPPDDDHPYFNRYFTWRALPEILALRERGGLPLIEMGYPVVVVTWLLSLIFGTVLILLPLRWFREAAGQKAVRRGRVFGYFAALGLAFMLLEIAFLQKFVLLLGHPLYAAVTVLSAFLCFAGWGSRYSIRLRGPAPVRWPVIGIVLVGCLYLWAMPWLSAFAVAWPLAIKLACGVLLAAPLAFFMGMPFPLGMARVAAVGGSQIPWAYGVNACFSVMSAPLATLLAIEIGFNGVVALALAMYGAAFLLFPKVAARAAKSSDSLQLESESG